MHAQTTFKKMRRRAGLIWVLSVALGSVAMYQVAQHHRYDSLRHLRLEAPLEQALEQAIRSLECSNLRNSQKCGRSSVREITTEVVIRLLPDHRCFWSPFVLTIHWPGGNVIGKRYAILIHRKTLKATCLNVNGDKSDFWAFLASQRLTIHDDRDATAVFQLYCDVLGKGGDQIPRLVSRNRWEIGASIGDDWPRPREYFHDVTVDEDGTIVSGRLDSRSLTVENKRRVESN